MLYGGQLDYTKIKKHPTEGETFFNQRTMANKALKAYLKGKKFFTYKGEQYAVPMKANEQSK